MLRHRKSPPFLIVGPTRMYLALVQKKSALVMERKGIAERLAMLKHRLARLEKLVKEVTYVRCPVCDDGHRFVFAEKEWGKPKVYLPKDRADMDEQGNCRACGGPFQQVLTAELGDPDMK